MRLAYNGSADTLVEPLMPTSEIAQYERKGCFTEAFFSFADTAGFRALGVALENETGVVVDNYSLRGNSGMTLSRLDSARCRELSAIRPYDLIVLQYGLNIVTDTVMQYGWYGKRMEEAVRHLRVCFPETDIPTGADRWTGCLRRCRPCWRCSMRSGRRRVVRALPSGTCLAPWEERTAWCAMWKITGRAKIIRT